MTDIEIEATLQSITTRLVDELVIRTPETMSEIQFEIVATEDGGADFGFLDNHPDARMVSLTQPMFDCISEYIPLVKEYVPEWSRSLITVRQSESGWKVTVDFENCREKN